METTGQENVSSRTEEELSCTPRVSRFWNAQPERTEDFGDGVREDGDETESCVDEDRGTSPERVSFAFIAPNVQECTKWLNAFTARMELFKEQSDWGPMYVSLVGSKRETEFSGEAVRPGECVCLVRVDPPLVASTLAGVLSDMDWEFSLVDLVLPRAGCPFQEGFDVLAASSGESMSCVSSLPLDVKKDEKLAVLLQSLGEVA